MTSYLERHASKSPVRKSTILEIAYFSHAHIQKIVTASLYSLGPCLGHRYPQMGSQRSIFPKSSHRISASSSQLLIAVKAMGNHSWIHSGRARVDSLFFRVGYVKDKKDPAFANQYPLLLKAISNALFFWKNSPPFIMKR